MGLQVWLPLNGNINNYGLSDLQFSILATNTSTNASGKIGSCYQNNSASAGGLLSDKTISLGQQQSMFCWFKFTSLTSTSSLGAGLVSQHRYSSNQGMGITIKYVSSTTGYLSVNTGNGSGRTYNTYCGTTLLQANTWYHGGYTYDGSTIRIYVNGVLEKTQAYANMAVPADYLTVFCWSMNSASGNAVYGGYRLIGSLNDVRIYDHCLSTKEIQELAKGLILHYKLDSGVFGNANLATCTTKQYTIAAGTGNYNYFWVNQNTLEANTTYTFSAEVLVSDGIQKCTIYNYTASGSSGSINSNFLADGQRHSWTFTTTSAAIGLIAYAGVAGATANHSAVYKNIKIEKGTVATPYLPKANEGGTTSDIFYDCSGYQNNGQGVNVIANQISSRYGAGLSFSGSSSYIKVINNNWLSQGTKEMTINLWAKNSSWATNTHFFSCTETGGFNTEPGNSGYLRFPIHVYTDSAQSATAYKYDSNELQLSAIPTNEWVMLTWVYDGTGTKTYINGVLHHTYTNTSYGIHFNTNARLFLGCEASTANPGTPYYNGQMSDFRMYSTAFTEAQIKELYNISATIDKAGNVYARELVE